MKIRSAVPENGCLINCGERKKQKKKTDCKTYNAVGSVSLRNAKYRSVGEDKWRFFAGLSKISNTRLYLSELF